MAQQYQIPKTVAQKIWDFLEAGKTGSVTLNITNGKIAAWEIRETGRIDKDETNQVA